jgi:hypothetical protein
MKSDLSGPESRQRHEGGDTTDRLIDIATPPATYADTERRITAGLGSLFHAKDPKVIEGNFEMPASTPKSKKKGKSA